MRAVVAVTVLLLATAPSRAASRADSVEDLRRLVSTARPGARIEIAPGTYRGGLHFTGVRGTKKRPVVIAAADPGRPPVFEGGASGMHFTDPAWVTLESLVFAGATGNGLNIDDGGSRDSPAEHVVLRDLVVRDVGPGGNRDGIKLSGVRDFLVAGCTIERWGDRGSGIDMVGCHAGRVTGCTFRHDAGKGGNGVQMKGGTADVLVDLCRFEDAGSRAVQIGGSTGRPYFRPALGKTGNAEARRIRVRGCTIVGSDAAVAFVGAEDCEFVRNTICRPRRWILRILQETRAEDFVPCREGAFRHNVVVWREAEVRTHVNVGPGTKPETFAFEGNWWYCEDRPARSRPALPGSPEDGVHGKDPRLTDPGKGDLTLRPGSPARGRGADSYVPPKAD